MIVEEGEGELRIKPAALIEVETYNDDQIAAWDRADILGPKERGQILARFQQA